MRLKTSHRNILTEIKTGEFWWQAEKGGCRRMGGQLSMIKGQGCLFRYDNTQGRAMFEANEEKIDGARVGA